MSSIQHVKMHGYTAILRAVGETKGKTDWAVEVPVVIAKGRAYEYGSPSERNVHVTIGYIRGDGHVKGRPTVSVRTSAYTRKIILEAIRDTIGYRNPTVERIHMRPDSIRGHEERILRILRSGGQVPRLTMGHRYEQAAFDKAFARVARKRWVRRSGDTLYATVPSRDARRGRRRSRRR